MSADILLSILDTECRCYGNSDKRVTMASDDQSLVVFQTRVRQMILQFQQLKKENEELYSMVDKSEQTIKELREELKKKNSEYDSLKMARMIGISDGDIETTKNRLSKLIRDVNKCIAVLTDQK